MILVIFETPWVYKQGCGIYNNKKPPISQAHDPFGSGRLTRPGLYLPKNDGLMATSFIDAVPSYSHFNFEADVSHN